ncbi:unnamed protein product [Rotaria magnacalcarata]|uniref:Uncharacterized protein n=1 Tax=Rotaria magnacalcarata TaxID=392030 RepID=A0A816UYP9_9BILA|nr:unnamed protein product [Rotaria magnacalcarata]CAF3834186.1 unnamed protein product [Rotaria magnacalcarata]
MALMTSHFKQYERMKNASESCSVHQCSSLPHSICNHCDHHFCHDHANEHENQCSQSRPHLINTIDKLGVRLSSIEPYCLEQLERWRSEAYQSINQYCNKKCYDLVEKKKQYLQQELALTRDKLDESIKEQDEMYNQIDHDINLIEIKLVELEHLRLKLRPLIIDENLVTSQCLLPLAHPNYTIHIKSGNESSIGSNERHLLVEREGKHLCLLDRNFTIVSEIPFYHGVIHSICWSSVIHRFIIVTFKQIFIFDDETMVLSECSISANTDWWRSTCSDDVLFLSTAEWGSSIHEFDLRESFQFIKTWHTPATCAIDEVICDIKYSNGFLAIPIFNRHTDESRLDLRSSKTLDCIWSIHIHGRCRCCAVNGDQWLVIDHDDCRFLHISADGQLLKTDKYDHHQRLEDVATWDENIIVVLTKKSINLHEVR